MKTENTDTIIIGAGLTGLTLAYFLKRMGHRPLILERSDRPGGVIQSHTEKGFTYESGPNTGVLSTKEIAMLFEYLSGECTLETGQGGANKRYVMKSGKWEPLPSGLFSAVTTPLFTLKDKFRILGEPFRKPGSNPDESVADMVRRRLGKSFLDYAVDPFISGIYAGDPSRLVTRYALPKLYALEQNYGSFIRGTVKKAREPKSDDDRKATKEVFSVQGGLGNLIAALEKEIGRENIRYGVRDLKTDYTGKGFTVSYTVPGDAAPGGDTSGSPVPGGEGPAAGSTGRDSGAVETQSVDCSRLVSTAGGYALPEILTFIPPEELDPILSLNYAGVVQVAAGYSRWTGTPLDAFGGLVPSREKRQILGILFPSAIFRERAPEGGALLSVFLGGTRNRELITKSDEEITDIALGEIRKTLGADGEPDLLKIFRYEKAIPQYEATTGERLECIRELEGRYPGLIIAGNIRDGIGMADRVKQARHIADIITGAR
ncbi:MAG: protoporphyrinogen oxidase [Bacteroidales bacterium]|jgi:oxygen-dependent protoporphyrinogen oxidase|nr:protoporphyrinogen oxidase [Bacteroidales bacterium]